MQTQTQTQTQLSNPPHFSPSPDVAQAPELNLVPAQEEGEEEDISGPQFVCETVIRSLTLEEAPDRSRLCSSVPSKRMHTTGDLSTPLCLLVTDGRGDLEHCFPHVPHSSVTWKILPGSHSQLHNH